jgi:hypothetical protein
MSRSVSIRLTMVSSTVDFTLNDELQLDLSVFTHLEHLELLGQAFGSTAVSYGNPPPLMNGMAFLKRLDVMESLVAHVPLRVYANLTHLCIQGFTPDITLVLQHLSGLQCLHLRDQSCDIYEVLADPKVRLQDLTSFALDIEDDTRDSPLDAESELAFVTGMKSLTRVLLWLPLWEYECQSTVLDVLHARLPHLTALGLSFHTIQDEIFFAEIAEALPRSLRALSLNLPWNAHSLDASYIMPLVSLGSLNALCTVN